MRHFTYTFCKVLAVFLVFFGTISISEAATIRINFNKALGSSYTLVAIEDSTGKTVTKSITSKAKTTSIKVSKPSRLYLRASNNKISRAIAVEKCSGKTFSKCSSTNVANLIKAGTFEIKVTSSPVLLASLKGDAYKKAVSTSSYVKRTALITALKAGGQASSLRVAAASFPGVRATASDADADGLSDSVDSDDDGDGTLDNYDSSTSSPSTTTFRVFSNFKSEIDQTLNVNAIPTLTTTQIDDALKAYQTLAIAVSGNPTDTVELDCGTLGYCSSGGTGTTGGQPFPGAAGGTFDSDGDGYGSISKGATGDFQLTTGATSSQIGAGDTMIQKVTAASATTSSDLTGILNFTFVTNPAVKSIGTTVESLTVDYTATPRNGSRQRCLLAPASGAVTLEITGWRPQRPGNSTLGEATYMDIGKSSIVLDIPNGPCSSPSGSCAPQGPGQCAGASYSTTDANLTVSAGGLEDKTEDQAASTSNTYSFSVNLDTCLSSAPSGAISWTSGQTLFVDLQFKSQYGDNAAQKFCITRQ